MISVNIQKKDDSFICIMYSKGRNNNRIRMPFRELNGSRLYWIWENRCILDVSIHDKIIFEWNRQTYWY